MRVFRNPALAASRAGGEIVAHGSPAARLKIGVEAAAPVAFQIKRHELVAESLEQLYEARRHLRIERPIELCGIDLDPHEHAVVAYPKLPEAEVAQADFPRFDPRKGLRRNFEAVGVNPPCFMSEMS